MKLTTKALLSLVAICAGSSSFAATIVDDSGTARNGKVGHWSSLVARGGNVAISYYCEDDMNNQPPSAYTLRFAWTTGTGWQWTTVDPVYCGSETSMALGTDSLYQIVYDKWPGIGWATGSATSWNVSSVSTPAEVAPANLSMVLDSQNRAHMAYMNYAIGGDRSLRYTFFDGTDWAPGGANEGIVATGLWTPTIGFSNTYLALDAGGTPHIALAQPSNPIDAYGPIIYAILAGGPNGTWQFESLGVLGIDPSLAIGNDNVPRMVFNGDAGVVYAHKTGGVWQFETIVAGENGSSNALALGGDNSPAVSFGLTANEDMYIARRGVGGWTVTRVDGDGDAGPRELLGRYGTSIDVDESGNTHVSYLAIDMFATGHRADLRYDGPGGGTPCVTISGQPSPAAPCPGSTAHFSLVASAPSAMSYQWRRAAVPLVDGPTGSGSTIDGANTAALTIQSANAGDEDVYDCVLNAECGSALSNAVTLALGSAAVVLTHPTSLNVCTGENAVFSVLASGSGTISHQWRKGGVALVDGPTGSGSTLLGTSTASLTISNAHAADVGSYDCAVINECGGEGSGPAVLSVAPCGGCVGDLNRNGRVDLSDLAILLSNYGDSGGVGADDGDIDGDGDVDLSDLSILLSVFGSAC